MSNEFDIVFLALRDVLEKAAGDLSVSDDRAGRYCLEGRVGPATLRAWGGRVRQQNIPVAWVETGKTYVSFHLMALYVDPKLAASMSKPLEARMQGKSCFNFKTNDAALFAELGELTAKSIAAFRSAGFVETR